MYILDYSHEFLHNSGMESLTRVAQRDRILKARVAIALYSEHGKVPKEEEVESMYRIARAKVSVWGSRRA